MSEIGEEIINRLASNSQLRNPNNPARKILLNTVGVWLDNEYEKEFLEQFFIQEAENKYLDLHGVDWDIKRNVGESDDNYRKRIIYESLGHLTIDFLKEVYRVGLYTNVDGFDVSNNTLTSDNPYINNKGWLGVADEETQEILNRKFVIGTGITWFRK